MLTASNESFSSDLGLSTDEGIAELSDEDTKLSDDDAKISSDDDINVSNDNIADDLKIRKISDFHVKETQNVDEICSENNLITT